jgi:hypothetical protein
MAESESFQQFVGSLEMVFENVIQEGNVCL